MVTAILAFLRSVMYLGSSLAVTCTSFPQWSVPALQATISEQVEGKAEQENRQEKERVPSKKEAGQIEAEATEKDQEPNQGYRTEADIGTCFHAISRGRANRGRRQRSRYPTAHGCWLQNQSETPRVVFWQYSTQAYLQSGTTRDGCGVARRAFHFQNLSSL